MESVYFCVVVRRLDAPDQTLQRRVHTVSIANNEIACKLFPSTLARALVRLVLALIACHSCKCHQLMEAANFTVSPKQLVILIPTRLHTHLPTSSPIVSPQNTNKKSI